jgi:hypothetical protein
VLQEQTAETGGDVGPCSTEHFNLGTPRPLREGRGGAKSHGLYPASALLAPPAPLLSPQLPPPAAGAFLFPPPPPLAPPLAPPRPGACRALRSASTASTLSSRAPTPLSCACIARALPHAALSWSSAAESGRGAESERTPFKAAIRRRRPPESAFWLACRPSKAASASALCCCRLARVPGRGGAGAALSQVWRALLHVPRRAAARWAHRRRARARRGPLLGGPRWRSQPPLLFRAAAVSLGPAAAGMAPVRSAPLPRAALAALQRAPLPPLPVVRCSHALDTLICPLDRFGAIPRLFCEACRAKTSRDHLNSRRPCTSPSSPPLKRPLQALI